MDNPKSQTGQPVNFGQRLVNIGQIDYFTLYLAGGSSVGTLNGLEKGKNRLMTVHRWPDSFGIFQKQ